MIGTQFTGDEQPGLMTPGNALFIGGPMFLQTAGLTHMVRQDNPFVNRRGGLRTLGRYASGLQSNVMMARKLTNQTWFAKKYDKLAPQWLKKMAPELSQLLPSRYLNLWSALSGSETALQGIGLQAGATRAKIMGDVLGDTNMFASSKSPMTSIGSARKFGGSFYDAPISFGEIYGKWGDYLDPNRHFQQSLKSMEGTSSWGRIVARESGLGGGSTAGPIATKIAGGMVRASESTGTAGQVFRGIGKAIPHAARIGGVAFAAWDVYNISLIAGSLVGKAGLAMIKAPVNRYNNMTADIHRGTFMTSSPLSPFVGATSRQRAIADVYSRNLNLRQVLGNEAAYMANLGY